jgi:DNA polymerase-3 subunit delta
MPGIEHGSRPRQVQLAHDERAATAPRLGPTMAWKPAYLIHGDDHGRIAERRASLRAKAEQESGSGGVEVFEGETATPDAVAAALSAMTFAMGRRFLIVEGVERWKEAETEEVAAALATIAPDTTAAFFAREEGRYKAPAALHAAVEKAGGAVATESAIKPWELPKWCVRQATGLGLELDQNAAKALVAIVGERQQRLLRELEKLALEHGAGAHITLEEVEEASAASAERKIWALGDAIVAGDRRGAIRVLLELRAQGERVPGLIYAVARRLREALAAAEALAEGKAPADVRRTLRMPPKAAEQFMAGVAQRDVDAFRRALVAIADLELESRGGGAAPMSEETAAVRAVLATVA